MRKVDDGKTGEEKKIMLEIVATNVLARRSTGKIKSNNNKNHNYNYNNQMGLNIAKLISSWF